ncbi:MAG: hypothetical protein ABIJ96_04025 [Elusimicrobiota bacterium]
MGKFETQVRLSREMTLLSVTMIGVGASLRKRFGRPKRSRARRGFPISAIGRTAARKRLRMILDPV